MILVDEKRFTNGINLKIVDKSSKIAGDRWAIKVICEISMPIPVDFMKSYSDNNQELFNKFYEKTAGEIRYHIVRERNFIDDKEHDRVIRELVLQFDKTVDDYLNSLTFPKKLVAKEFEKFKLGYREPEPANTEDTEEEEGPVDFSMCFKKRSDG